MKMALMHAILQHKNIKVQQKTSKTKQNGYGSKVVLKKIIHTRATIQNMMLIKILKILKWYLYYLILFKQLLEI